MKATVLSLNRPEARETHLRVNAKRESNTESARADSRRLLNQLECRFNQALWQPVGEHLGSDDPRPVQPGGVTDFAISSNADRKDPVRPAPPLQTRGSIGLEYCFRNT